ncbi:T9SS type A sorting domain-containing protein [Zobellia roscoffensis]|uniref:T9SS type A sorting domain-containing protein n=1 Tax=Zobellia roscoffensis TaxID=2779508 RepID=UPI0039EE2F30
MKLSESSGLLYFNDRLITHNDSGNLPQLYEIDMVSLEIQRTITITNAENRDWEDIAQDETYIYIGDIGNNNGTRKDLLVYRILKSEYLTSDTLEAEKIEFEYENQDNFDNNGNSDWDAEALFVLQDKLIILTKQWNNYGTVAYSLPREPGRYMAKELDGYKVNGLVTGADFNPITEQLYIVGYTSILAPFLYVIDGATTNAIFGRIVKNLKIDIGTSQVESIIHVNANTYYLTSEQFERQSFNLSFEPKLYSLLVTNSFLEHEEEEEEEEETGLDDEGETKTDENQEESEEAVDISEGIDSIDDKADNNSGLIVVKSATETNLIYLVPEDGLVLSRAVYDASGRRLLLHHRNEIENSSINISSLKSGIYYLTLSLGGTIVTKPFVVQ